MIAQVDKYLGEALIARCFSATSAQKHANGTKVFKGIPKSTIFCPDCGSALVWKRFSKDREFDELEPSDWLEGQRNSVKRKRWKKKGMPV
jgi:hypothetical protein